MLTKKNILLISPQPWGGLFVSKHHYAVELARRGNNVFFLCPIPYLANQNRHIQVTPVPDHDRLFLVEHKLWFPFQLKFHFPSLFYFLIRIHLGRILSALKAEIDVVWSFDLGNYFPFRFFEEDTLRIFHPVDEPLNKTAIDSADSCQVIFGVTQSILDKYRDNPAPAYVIGHGVADDFFRKETNDAISSDSETIRIGISGNMRRKDIDRDVLLDIISANPSIVFDFFGSYEDAENSGGKRDIAADTFIKALRQLPNVKLHGLLSPGQLAEAYPKMDAFLISYDVLKDQSNGTNYHKILEFMSTGKVIISNNISSYWGNPDLVQMVEERDSIRNLPVLFKRVVTNLKEYNSDFLMKKRIAFAASNRYSCQVDKIDSFLLSLNIN